MELRMVKESTFELSTEERVSLRSEILDLLREYDYHPTEYAVDKILNEWAKNKGWMVDLFKKHPNYNGRYQISFDADFNRVVDREIIYMFADYVARYLNNFKLEEIKVGCFTYSEIYKIYCKVDKMMDYMYEIEARGCHVLVNGKTYSEMKKERNYWLTKLRNIERMDNVVVYGNKAYDKADYRLQNNAKEVLYYIRYHDNNLATEEFVRNINSYMPELKAVEGQKVSRIVGKFCKLIGLDKDENYNREFAKYSDAINPLAIKRHTLLSCHPVDYLTMSFGNSWASCHTIDKENYRGMPDSYNGCYSSGTLSYMLDTSSFVFYTVDKGYDGNVFELQDKINRNMFHMGEDKLIQARVYPQCTDGENGMYKQIREVVQKVIADCLDVPNMWKNIKGIDACGKAISTYGTHYKDYVSFNDCNVSYLKGNTDEVNENRMFVGHNPICPSCGKEHDDAECIECNVCYRGEVECADCGRDYSIEDMHEINGRYYCSDCCFYCDYHGRYETGASYYVSGYGNVCDDALDTDDFYQCAECGDRYHVSHGYVETEDGTYFCDADCAYHNGYGCTTDGEWYPEHKLYHCNNCDNTVHDSDWNEELDCCKDCEDEVRDMSIEETIAEEVENELAEA